MRRWAVKHVYAIYPGLGKWWVHYLKEQGISFEILLADIFRYCWFNVEELCYYYCLALQRKVMEMNPLTSLTVLVTLCTCFVLTPSWKFCYIEDSRGKRTICLYAAIAKARFVGQGFMAQKELAIEIRSPISRSKTKNSYLEEVGTTLISLETEFVKVRSYYSV